MDFSLEPNTTGTYAKVIQYGLAPSSDIYLVLYLLDSGVYLFIGYWQGYELTVAVGRWNEKYTYTTGWCWGNIVYGTS
jgi:hypothetical protein